LVILAAVRPRESRPFCFRFVKPEKKNLWMLDALAAKAAIYLNRARVSRGPSVKHDEGALPP
jgi:hypothetical protein